MICGDPFKNLNIVSYYGTLSVSPCCLISPTPCDQIDFENNQNLKTTRESWLSGTVPPKCTVCNQKPSRKDGSNQWYIDNNLYNTDVELLRIDYWTGDLCNLRCAICGPSNSSSWKQELNIPDRKQTVNQFWKDLDLSKLQYIHFNGGEPLLSKEHVLFLKELPAKQNICLNYNTNGTVLPSEELINIWSQCKIVQIDFSIDDIGERFEYQRYPANWENVKDNLQWFIDNCPVNCMFAVNTTVSILNYHNLENLRIWLKNNFYSNRVGDQIEYRTQPASGLFSVNPSKSLNHAMINFLNNCDARRGTDWASTFPELAQLK